MILIHLIIYLMLGEIYAFNFMELFLFSII